MFSRKRVVIFCILWLLLLPYGVVLAKGAPDRIKIISPDLPDSLVITDPKILEPLADPNLIDFNTIIEEPKGVANGYEITRYYQVGGIGLKAIDKFVYYPNSDGGYIFYTGIIDKMFIYGGSPFDGKWFLPTEDGNQAMLQLLADYGVRPVNDSLWQSFLQNPVIWLGYIGLIGVVTAVFFMSYRNLSIRRKVT